MMTFEEETATHLGMPPYTMVYFLLLSGEVVYVGQTAMGSGRISAHLTDKFFDDVYAIPCDLSELDGLEDYYIWKYRPKYNRKPNPAVSVSLARVKKTVEDALACRVGLVKIKKVMQRLDIQPRDFNGVLYITEKELLSLIDWFIAEEESGYV